MQRPGFSKVLAASMAGVLLMVGGLKVASAADATDNRVRVRGTVVALSGDQLQVKARDGNPVAVKLAPGWVVMSVVKARVSDIKPGDFVGITSVPRSEGGDGALEVLIFPPQLRGTSEGSFAYDLQPNSTMTNATVANAVKSVNGRVVTVNYHGQEKQISIQDGTPVVTLAPAVPADLKPGAVVFVTAEKTPGGDISSRRVIVGKNGVVPPM